MRTRMTRAVTGNGASPIRLADLTERLPPQATGGTGMAGRRTSSAEAIA